MKILLVALDNLGDTVLSLPVYEALRRGGHEVALWTKEYTSGLAALVPGSPRFFSCDPFWDRSPGRGKGSLLPFARTLAAIRGARFDAAASLRSNWRKNLACALAGIPERWAAGGTSGWFATRRLPPQLPGEHVLDFYRRGLKDFFGADPGELRCSLPRPASPPAQAYAAVHPFSGGKRRNLAPQVWRGIISGLRSRGLEVLVISTPAEKAALGLPPGSGVRFSSDGDTSIAGMAAGISGARFFIGHDSGPLHLAAALAVPAVGIIQRSKVPVIAPRGPGPLRLAVFAEAPAELDAAAVLAHADALKTA